MVSTGLSVVCVAFLVSLATGIPPDFSWRSHAAGRVRSLDVHSAAAPLESPQSPSTRTRLSHTRVRVIQRVRDLTVSDLEKEGSVDQKQLSKLVVRSSSDESEAQSAQDDKDESKMDRGNVVSPETVKDEQVPAGETGQANNQSRNEDGNGEASENAGNVSDVSKESNEGTTKSINEADPPSEEPKSDLVPNGSPSTNSASEPEDEAARVSSSEGETDDEDAGEEHNQGVTDAPTPTMRSMIDDGSQVKWVNETVTIGKNQFRKDEVTSIGDIDGNGYSDYVVANPSASGRAGSIRLYLMRQKDQFLFSRELVPGKWGFQAPALKAGDNYGRAVYKIPSTDHTAPCVIAVGAPGDNAKGKKKGAIYLLQVSDKGSISKTLKISADTDKSLARQHDENEGFGEDITAIGDLNGDGDLELVVKSVLGSTTLLFLNSSHGVKAGLKMHNEDNTGLMGLVKSYGPKRSGKLDATELDSVSIRAGVAEHCFFNETRCACGLASPEEGSASCLDVVGEESGTGKTLCNARDCKPSYVCSCDGTELCSRVHETKQVYAVQGPATGGQVYCALAPITVTVNNVLEGVPIPTPEVRQELSTFNSTHCRCSPKKALVEPYQCLDFLRTEESVAVVCKPRECKVGENEYSCDGMGTGYCTREFRERDHYVNDGDVENEVDAVYCHQVTSTNEIVTRIM